MCRPSELLVSTVIWAPFALIFTVCLAVRVGLSLPIELRANWMFRLTEPDAVRSDQLARRGSYRVCDLASLFRSRLVFPLQWMILGPEPSRAPS